MEAGNKSKGKKNNSKGIKNFRKKHINHDPQAESARAVFGKENI